MGQADGFRHNGDTALQHLHYLRAVTKGVLCAIAYHQYSLIGKSA